MSHRKFGGTSSNSPVRTAMRNARTITVPIPMSRNRMVRRSESAVHLRLAINSTRLHVCRPHGQLTTPANSPAVQPGGNAPMSVNAANVERGTSIGVGSIVCALIAVAR